MKLNKGEILGFETDTVWGLGCLPLDESSVDAIYEIKNRDRSKPLILMSNSIENLLPYVFEVPQYAEILMEKYFPGALTLIFKKSNICPDFLTSGRDTIGIRIPSHLEFQQLCSEVEGNVLATTSLNVSNEPACKDYTEAVERFGSVVKIIQPKVPENKGVESTVLLCTGDTPVVLRQGAVYI